MWFSRTPILLLSFFAAICSPAGAEQMLSSSSLNSCQADSGFTASLFNVVYTPANSSATVDLSATSSIQGSVIFDVSIVAYGLSIIRQQVDPCKIGLAGLCPMYVHLPSSL